MLHEQGGYRVAGAQPGADLPERVACVGVEGALGRTAPLGLIEPEAEQRRDEAAGPAAVQIDGFELAGLRIPSDEQRLQDAKRAARLDALERPDEAPLVLRTWAEGVEQQLSGS